jgi:hypothetical protein
MHAGAGVQDHVTRGQPDGLRPVRILDDEFPALVFVRAREKQRRRQVRANPHCRAANLSQRIVHVIAEALADAVAVEKRREHSCRQCRGEKQQAPVERVQNFRPEFTRLVRTLGQLAVVLYPARLVTGGDVAVSPAGALQSIAEITDVLWTEHVRDSEQHTRRQKP